MVVAEGGKAVLLDINEDAGARLADELGGRPGTSPGPSPLSATPAIGPRALCGGRSRRLRGIPGRRASPILAVDLPPTCKLLPF
ncbi:hypothetical protein [Burkholderia ambifaria]|jgi:hypothetical protein|uniref:hypothetical protein n=1 Tax=Burkholderia ambifaria TaxID=152480 RepID=UPI003D15F395